MCGDPGDEGTNHVTVITFSCAAIHFPVEMHIWCGRLKAYIVGCAHYHAYLVWEVKDPLSQ